MASKKGERVPMDEKKLSDAVAGKPMHYPSMLSLDEGDLPEVKNWKVGKTYKVELEIKQVASSVGEHGTMPSNDSDKEKVHCKFEVVKAEVYDDKEEKE